jgi:tRNA(Ile)-lysidine synthase
VKSGVSSSASSAADRREAFARRAIQACDAVGLPAGEARIVVACSGGVDSAAALLLVRAARPRAHIVACYVDHGVRAAEAIACDVRAVRAQAKAAGARSCVVRLGRVSAAGIGLESALRRARYEALGEVAASHGASHVVTGHHRGDLAESTLLALARGSGIDGLGAMRPARPLAEHATLVRPLLWASKRILERYVEGSGVPTSVDETNDDVTLRRNAVRRLLAQLEAVAPGAERSIARSAVVASDDRALLDAVTASAHRRAAREDGSLAASALRGLPMPLLRRVLRRAVAKAAGSTVDLTYDHCAAVARAIVAGRGGSYHAGPVRFELSAGLVRVRPTVAVKTAQQEIDLVAPRTAIDIAWNGGTIALRRKKAPRRISRREAGVHLLDGGQLREGTPLRVRSLQAGDRIVPSGRSSAVSLSRFLAKAGIARSDRASVPLLCHGNDVVAAIGVRANSQYAARPGGEVLEVRWMPHGDDTRARRSN